MYLVYIYFYILFLCQVAALYKYLQLKDIKANLVSKTK